MGRIDRDFEPQAEVAGFPPAGITMTDAAVTRLRQMLDDEGEADLKLRMYVTGGGCAGMQYGFAFDAAAADDDLLFEQGGVGVLVDSISLQYLAGATVDFKESLEGARFVIDNPQATSTCGCGSSFSVAG
jgi:iron-sulfur cluster insertion protein